MTASSNARSLTWWINASLVTFGAMLTLILVVQGQLSQRLIEHPLWRQVLESATQSALKAAGNNLNDALPTQGSIKGWLVSRTAPLPPDMPPFLARLTPGYYSESELESLTYTSPFSAAINILTPHWGPFAGPPGDSARVRNYAVLVTPVRSAKLIMVVDMTELEDEQNGGVQLSLLFLLANLSMIGLMIWWIQLALTGPVNDLARRMRALNPLQPSQRLPAIYRKSELNTIAMETNAHLERVQLAIERERSLLDQASHEFRTPVAIISGAADVLHKLALPEAALRPLQRIHEAVATLTQIMEALLFLSREADPAKTMQVTLLHALLPDLVADHAYLLKGKPVCFVIAAMDPLILHAPESMVRIAAGNLLRNAAEHTHEGEIRVSLCAGTLRICDAGSGFDATLAAQRYTDSLRQPGRQGGGTGLGLFLTQRICERFNWQLTLQSSISIGTSAAIIFTAP